MKKIFSLSLALLMALSLSGCLDTSKNTADQVAASPTAQLPLIQQLNM